MFARVLQRYGGMLVRPRATVAALDPKEGLHDGSWLGLLYLLGGHVHALMEAVATAVAVRNWSGLLVLGSQLGRSLLAPILVLLVAETVLGPGRRHRRGLCLVPLLLVAVASELLSRGGIAPPWPRLGPALVGGLASAGLAAWIRPAITCEDEG